MLGRRRPLRECRNFKPGRSGPQCHRMTDYVNQTRGRGGGFKKRAFWAGGGFKTLDGEDSDAPDISERPLRLRAWAILMTPRLVLAGDVQSPPCLLFSAIIGQAVEESLKFVIRQVHQVPFGPLAVHAGLWRELCINPRVKIGTAAQTVAGAAIG